MLLWRLVCVAITTTITTAHLRLPLGYFVRSKQSASLTRREGDYPQEREMARLHRAVLGFSMPSNRCCMSLVV